MKSLAYILMASLLVLWFAANPVADYLDPYLYQAASWLLLGYLLACTVKVINGWLPERRAAHAAAHTTQPAPLPLAS